MEIIEYKLGQTILHQGKKAKVYAITYFEGQIKPVYHLEIDGILKTISAI